MRVLRSVAAMAASVVALTAVAGASAGGGNDVDSFTWTKLTGSPGWTGRAGLQAVELRNRLYVMGGRTPAPLPGNPFASTLWNDVWTSRDRGVTWSKVGNAPWAARGYFQAVTKDGSMYVFGGQNLPTPPFSFVSTFFADVWRSDDGATWEQLTPNAGWAGRAGLSAIVFKGWIYVMGGSSGDDFGGGGRTFYNDVWRSRDGARWERVTAAAAWSARAGAAIVEKDGFIYLLGGEDGFFCTGAGAALSCPYFHDVWRSRDGATWDLVTSAAGWSERPGHQCQVLQDEIVCFGGFGWPTNPFVPAHPMDVWTSRDGATWQKLSGNAWNATWPGDVKYDFDSLVVTNSGGGPAIFTFGGDREASFIAPDPNLVDADVWKFGRM